MSFADRRAELKAAIDLVDELTGYEYRPASPRPGDAYPVMGPATKNPNFPIAFDVTWRIGVWLPQDEKAASDWIEENVLAIVEGLESSGAAFVEGFEPANFGTETNYVYGLLITTRSE